MKFSPGWERRATSSRTRNVCPSRKGAPNIIQLTGGKEKPLLALTATPDAPTVASAKAAQAAFDYFNEHLFKPIIGQPIPQVLLTFSRKKGAAGFFVPGSWKKAEDGHEAHEIALCPEHTGRPFIKTMSTLVHEMAHEYDHIEGRPGKHGYHSRSWFTTMNLLGLPGRKGITRGGKESNTRVSHDITPGGPFEVAFNAMPGHLTLPFTAPFDSEAGVGLPGITVLPIDPLSKHGRRAKYECPGCTNDLGAKAPVLRGPCGLSIICGDHDIPLQETGF